MDKLPDNIRFLGLIALLWPGARVIVCNRDLRDIAPVLLAERFRFLWSKNWDHIAAVRRLWRIVAHWRHTKAVEWLDVSYEGMVGDLERHAPG